MIYLIDNRVHYKIGFTTNIKNRLTQYKTESCDNNIINYKIGSKEDEKNLKHLLKPYKYQGEWCDRNQKVLDIFNNYESKYPFDIKELINSYKTYLINCLKSNDFTKFKFSKFNIDDVEQIQLDKKYFNITDELTNVYKYIKTSYELYNNCTFYSSNPNEQFEVYPNVILIPNFIISSNDISKSSAVNKWINKIKNIISIIDDNPTINEIDGWKDTICKYFNFMKSEIQIVEETQKTREDIKDIYNKFINVIKTTNFN